MLKNSFFFYFNEYLLKFFSKKYPRKFNLLFVEISINIHWKFWIGSKIKDEKVNEISLKPIIHLKFNDYLLKYSHWHLSDIWLSLQGISYISLKFQHSFQTVFALILCLHNSRCTKSISCIRANTSCLYIVWQKILNNNR